MVETGGSIVQGHSWSYIEFRASLGCKRYCFKEGGGERREEKRGLDGEGRDDDSCLLHPSYYLCCWRRVWGQMSNQALCFRGCKKGCAQQTDSGSGSTVSLGVTSIHQTSDSSLWWEPRLSSLPESSCLSMLGSSLRSGLRMNEYR